MLDSQWYAITPASRVRPGRPLALRRFGRDLVVWRSSKGTVAVAPDACSHRGAALSRGRLVDDCLECPYHGLRFDSDGRCTHIPAYPAETERDRFDLNLLPVREERGLVWAWKGPVSGALPDLPWDDSIDALLHADGAPSLDITDQFDVSYLRVMENLTDYHHVPFVHRGFVPAPSEVTHFEARREGHHVYASGRLGESLSASTHIVGPCFAMLEFGGVARFVVCATPIDAGNTWLFARYTQSMVRIPGLTLLATWLLGQFDYRLLQRLQDAPVWRSQRNKTPEDISRYGLLEADAGVRLYFEMHADLAR